MTRSIAAPLSELFTLAAADDLNGVATSLDVSGAQQVIIVQQANGTAGTAGIDIIEFSVDNAQWAAATAANLAAVGINGHAGLQTEDGTKAATSGAALNAAGVEPTVDAIFSLGALPGPCKIRCSRGAVGSGTAWVTGAPSVVALVVGGNPVQA